MNDYLGIVVGQSLADRACLDRATIVAERAVGSWRLLLVRVPAAEFEAHLGALQAGLVREDEWYAHYFRDDELVVVFHDGLFRVTTDRSTWGPAVEHGLARGVPPEQLDFTPRTVTDAEAFFGRVTRDPAVADASR